MKSTDSFSILIYPKQGKNKSNIQKLYSKITFNSKLAGFSLKRSIDIEQWDPKRGKMKGTSFESKKVNTYIEQIRAEIFEAYDSLRRENKVITAEGIKNRFLKIDDNDTTLLQAIDAYLIAAETTLKYGTFKHYKTLRKYVNTFLKEDQRIDDIKLSMMEYSLVSKFEVFLRVFQPKEYSINLSNNSLMKHIQRLNTIVRHSVKQGWLKINPFENYTYSYIKTERVILSQIEIDAVIDKHITISRLDYIRDLFVFSCYTGLSYIDVMNLTPFDLSRGIDGHKWIFTERYKTSVPVKLPILNIAQEIIDTYIDDPRSIHRGTVFPKISNQKLNAYLKELADICGIHKNLTFHVARHTFATTIALSNGVPIETVSKMLGHTKISTTQIYAKVLEHKISDDMSMLRNKLENGNQQKRITG